MTRARAWRWAALSTAVALALLLIFWWISLRGLAVVPPAFEDEAWIASVGWKFSQTGLFGSDMMAGLFDLEQRNVAWPPLHVFVSALAYRALGLGLWQTRWVVMVEVLVVLALTYALGRRLFGPPTGVLAVAVLILVRTAGITRYMPTGILMLDLARIGRYDVGVALFGLAAMHAYLSARRSRRQGWLIVSGLLAGLSGLYHFYGAGWLVVLSVLLLADPAWGRPIAVRLSRLAALASGALLLWALFLARVALNYGVWRDQVALPGDRLRFFDAAWYAANIFSEGQRYGPGLGAPGWHYLLRPGVWLMAIGGAAAILALGWRAWRREDQAAFSVAACLVIYPVLLALLVFPKVASYLNAFWPVLAVAVGWGAWALWRWAVGPRGWLLRAALVAVCLAVGMEGATRINVQQQMVTLTTPYDAYLERVRAAVLAIAPAPRVLGLHTYWLGFDDLDYTSWFVPISLAAPPPLVTPRPVETVLDGLAPDVVLVDERIRIYLDADPGDQVPRDIAGWLAANYVLAQRIEDPTYESMDVYKRRRPGP